MQIVAPAGCYTKYSRQHMACDLYRAIQAFTTEKNTVEYYGNIAESAEWAKTIIYYLLNVVRFIRSVHLVHELIKFALDWRHHCTLSLLCCLGWSSKNHGLTSSVVFGRHM